MAKGLQVRCKFDVSCAAEFVEGQHVFRRERIYVRADRRMARKVERVLDVELQVVVFVGPQGIDQIEQCR